MHKPSSAALTCLVLLALAAAAPPSAHAADSIYWADGATGTIQAGNLDGSGAAANLFAGESTPEGVAIDPATNRIYWANIGGTIRVANLDGSGAPANLFAGESNPFGVAIDPANNRIYWANSNNGTMRVGNLDGSGAASTLFAGEGGPRGVAIDPATNRIYWANAISGTIRVGNLDGTGVASSLFAGQTNPFGVAIDPAANRIYWANLNGGTIRVGNLDGSGTASDLFAGENVPFGVAIDPAANRIYWTSIGGDAIRVANLDGSGAAANLFAGQTSPTFTALLRTPLGAGAPAISGGGAVGQQLSCGQGAWAADLLGAFLFRAPASFAYHWLRDGAEIPGATTSTYTPTEAGSYSCRVTATNQAGSAAQTSATLPVSAAAQPAGCEDVSLATGFGAPVAVELVCSGEPPLVHEILGAPADGEISGFDPGAGTLTFTPGAGFSGSDSFTYRATSEGGPSEPATVEIEVAGSSPLPPAQDFSFGKLRRNTEKGTVFLAVIVPGPGQIGYRGKGETRAAGADAHASRQVTGGRLWLKIKPGRFGKRKLAIRRKLKRGSGRASVTVFVTYVPRDGSRRTKARTLTLIRK